MYLQGSNSETLLKGSGKRDEGNTGKTACISATIGLEPYLAAYMPLTGSGIWGCTYISYPPHSPLPWTAASHQTLYAMAQALSILPHHCHIMPHIIT